MKLYESLVVEVKDTKGAPLPRALKNIDYTGQTQLSQLFKECLLQWAWVPGCVPGLSTDTKLPTKLLSTPLKSADSAQRLSS